MPSQSELVSLFRELTELLILEEGGPQTFRVRAYENATDAIKASHEDLASMSASKLAKLEGEVAQLQATLETYAKLAAAE